MATKEELAMELIRLYKLLNKKITRDDILKHSVYKYHRYIRAFGTLTNAKRYAKIPITTERLDNKQLIELLNEILKEKDGTLLSNPDLITAKNTLIRIKCNKCDYEFDTTIMRLRSRWCLRCSEKMKKTIEDVHEAAKKKNLVCLSKEYMGANTKLRFKCKIGHEFDLSPSKLWNTTAYCSACSSGLYERISRCYFEQLFSDGFPSEYPEWLVNSNGNKMQLDGYCKKLGLAFEHQGRQHYEKNKFISTDNDLNKRILLDKEKKEICNNNGVKLFIIPELDYYLEVKNLKEFIKEEAVKLKVELPSNYDDIEIDLTKAYSSSPENKERFENLKQVVKDKEGELLIDNYMGASNIKIKCKYGNIFSPTYSGVVGGKWCGCIKCLREKNKVSEETIEKFIKSYQDGLTIKQAAEKHGFKKSYGFCILRERGLTRNKSEARKLIKALRKYEYLESEIIRLNKLNYSNSEISKKLNIDTRTVKIYINNYYNK